ncbi:MAG: histidine kinase [Lachnospiraceae bacterium]|nr:histidine kinase [Lachnospiraceae bacterium]
MKLLWNKIKKIFKKQTQSIQFKLVIVFLLTCLVLLIVNVVLYQSMNQIVQRLDSVYEANVSLNELQEVLDHTQNALTQYLSAKSADAMEEYYINENVYLDMIKKLNNKIVNQEMLMMEKNIRELSFEYLKTANKVIDAKRGKNIEKYKVYYQDMTQLYDIISTHIYALNNQRFVANSRSYQSLQSSMEYSKVMNIVILLFVAIANTVLIIIFTREMIQPLRKLSLAANKVAKGNLEVEYLPITSKDEIGVLTFAFNEMLESIKIYIKKIRQNMEQESAMKERELMMENHLKDAQLKYLQAQINPHFLFNTLNAGAQLAMMEGADKTYTYVQNVADFFRYNIKSMEEVTLEDELVQVKHYIYILNVRFSGDIHFNMDVENSCKSVSMPGMILQPIVENSVNYGISDIDWQAKIEISATREDEYVWLSIRDNGIGMEQKKIDQIMSGQLKEDEIFSDSNGVGLNNVIQRLRMFYNKEDVIEITSVGKNMGTEVAIKLYWRGEV